jgi:uncharacterized protein
MLIEFSITNFKSIQTTQTLSMAARSFPELRKQNSFLTSEKGVPRLLRSAAIYGPNASGKSNLLESINFMKNFILESSKEGQEGEPIEVNPFLFNTNNQNQPSEFEVLFMQEGVRYQYGFAVTTARVIREWLIAYPEGRPQRWFEREFDSISNKENWYFGSRFKGHKAVLQDATRSNALFLSTAIQLNNDQLKPIYNWFHKKLRTISARGLSPTFSASLCETETGRKRILDLLNIADLNIKELKLETKKFDTTDLPSELPDTIKDMLKKELDGKELSEVKFMHGVVGSNELIALDSDDESVGTRKLFTLAGPWIDVLDNGYVLFVDELDNSMHPLMVRFLIKLINNPEINKKNAQLIFSTHDTSVLDNDLFRRDQIWFTEKDSNNATKLYPLSDFTPRNGEALEKGYLKGRYGAIPYIGDLRF